MSNIVISGYYGFGNAGDEAMLNAIVDSIRDIEPTANITVISGNPSETSKKHNLQAVGTFAMFPIMSALMKADLLISGGGSLLQDATSIRNTYYYLSIMSMAKMLGKGNALCTGYWTFVQSLYTTCGSESIKTCGLHHCAR